MEPVDSRSSASTGTDDSPVVFDMIDLDPGRTVADDHTPSTPNQTPAPVSTPVPVAPMPVLEPMPVLAPLDAVPGVDPSASSPLSEPAVHPPIGSGVSQLEEALARITEPPPVPPPPAPPAAAPTVPPAPVATAPIAAPAVPETAPDPTADTPLAPSPATSPAASPAPVDPVDSDPALPTVAPSSTFSDSSTVADASTAVSAAPAPTPEAAPAGEPMVERIEATEPAIPSHVAPAVPSVALEASAPAPDLDVAVDPAPEQSAPERMSMTLPQSTVRASGVASTGDVATETRSKRSDKKSSKQAGSNRQETFVPMLPARLLGVIGTVAALCFFGVQAIRVVNDEPRSGLLTVAATISGIVGAIGVVAWTWVVTSNARRFVSPAKTQNPPDPRRAALTWVVPMVFIGGAAASVTYLSDRFHSAGDGVESSLPYILGLIAMIIAVPMMYSPVTYLSSVVRKVGGKGVRFGEWIWVSVALAAVGVLMIAGLRFGGAFGEDYDGLAPAWVVGVAAIVPAVVIVYLGWRGASAVEAAIVRAFDKRRHVSRATSQRRGMFAGLAADGGPNRSAMHKRGQVKLVPGAQMISLVVAILLGGLALLSLVGGLVMLMFWQEARDGVLEASQTTNAWELLDRLKSVERLVIFVAVAATMLWSAIAITNVRLASARRRNPAIAALTWPAAAVAIWAIGARVVADGSILDVVAGLAAQAVVLAVPFLFMYRSAGSIGSRRQAVRISWALGVIVLVHVQGLGGLSTAATTVDSTEVARLCGYLVIGAVLHLLVMFAAAAAMGAIVDTTAQVADRHNALIAQRTKAEAVRSSSNAPRPSGSQRTAVPAEPAVDGAPSA